MITLLETIGVCAALLLAPGLILFFALMGELEKPDECDDD